jgi:hypothetical protein
MDKIPEDSGDHTIWHRIPVKIDGPISALGH